jgi:predicted RNA-binding Zn ribbon-like protein
MIRSILLAVLAVVGITYGIYQHWEAREKAAHLQQVTQEAIEAKAAAERAQAEVEVLRSELATANANVARLTKERDEARSKGKDGAAVALEEGKPAAPATPGAGEAGGMKAFAKMFETEEGKKMMRANTQMVTQMQYGDLARLLKLSPQESEQVLALLADRQSEQAEQAFKMMGADGNVDAVKQLGESMTALNKEYNEKLRAVLGPEKFKEFEGYEKTVGDRMILTHFEGQFSAAGAPLQAPQKDALLQIMAEERKKLPEPVFDTTGQNPGRGIDMLQDDAAVETFLKQEEEYRRRVLAAAPKTLSPDQVNALQRAYEQLGQMQRFGIKMNREFFKTNKQPAPANP